MKTNKSFTKRLRITKTGKIIRRKPGGNHFNAKEASDKKIKRRVSQEMTMSNKSEGRFLPNK